MTLSPLFRETQEWLAVCLATTAGFVDAYGFLSFKTFVSFMSGNTTHSGFGPFPNPLCLSITRPGRPP
ncbi:MAG: DUF1275 family protein [Thermodesulfobacteriota bacterium]